MRRLRGTIYLKVVAVMLTIIFISALVPYLIFSQCYRRYAEEEIKEKFVHSLENAAQYLEENHLPLTDLEKVFGDGFCKVFVRKTLDGVELTPEQQETLTDEKEVILTRLPNERRRFTAITRYRDSYIIWHLQAGDLFQKTHNVGLLAVGISVLLGTTVAAIAGRTMTDPIQKLDEATKRVAAGDFSLQLANPYRDEIGSLVNSFNIMTRELASVEMLRSDFVSDISHEFKTPLTAIEGYAKLLADEQDPDERNEYVQIIVEETGRLSALAQNILTMNKLEKGNIPAQRERVCIDEQIRRALALCESKWSAKQLELELDLCKVEIGGVEPLLMQVWTNLIDNAIKFSPQGGKIRITLLRAGRKCIFKIQDEGPGIPQRDLGHIFSKFYKGDKSRGSDGNGLGLSIARRVVEIHGGGIRAENTPQGGACFTITL